jgi:hypothetical protein
MPTKRELSIEEFRKQYPHLSREMEGSGKEDGTEEEGLEGEVEEEEEVQGEGGQERRETAESEGYEPTVLDYLARCDTDKQALEIIDYMERRGEISKEQAASLRRRLKEKGVRTFGQKRGSNHYYKKFSR